MPRKMAAKRSRGETSSSSAPEIAPEMTVCKMLTFKDREAKGRYDILSELQMNSHKYIDWETVRTLNIEEQVNAALQVGKFRELFAIKEPSYRELTLEFLCTLSVDANLRYQLPKEIKFRIGGKPYNITMRQFSSAIGIYTEEEMDAREFNELGISETLVDNEEYWKTISDDDNKYKPSRSKASHLNSDAMRYLHKVMAHSISGRGGNPGVVNRRDLYHIWSMLENRPVNIAQSILYQLHHQATARTMTEAISVGPYVTKLINGLGIMPSCPDMTMSNRWHPVNIPTLVNMHMVKMDPRTRRYYLVHARAEEEASPLPQAPADAPAFQFHTNIPSSSSSGPTLQAVWEQTQQLARDMRLHWTDLHTVIVNQRDIRRTQRRQDCKLDAILANLAMFAPLTGGEFIHPVYPPSSEDDNEATSSDDGA